MTALLVAVGGGVGAALRWWLGHEIVLRFERWVAAVAVNLIGAITLGALGASAPSTWWWSLAGVGFLGAFTTFSGFAADTVRVVEQHGARWAVVLVSVMVAGGWAAAVAGRVLVG